MPFYEYKCQKCEEEFEEFQGIFDDPIEKCKLCDGEVMCLISRSTGKVTYNDSKELYEKEIKPEAKRIADQIRSGNEDAAADIFGETQKIG
jgi:putative FmdB family regulatory protein